MLQLAPQERLELARIIAKELTEAGVVSKIEPLAVSQGTAAALLDCCPKTIRTLRKSRDLDTVLVGRVPYVSMASIKALVVRQTEQPAAAAA